MIARIWRGWTTHENADKFEELVTTVVFKDIENKKIEGYQGMQLLRKTQEKETEFISMMWFEKIENVEAFVGKDYKTAHVPQASRDILKRFDTQVEHFDVKHQLDYK